MRPSPRRGGLPALAVARPVTVAMSLAALLVVGAIAFRQIPLQLLPSGFDPPFMWVQVPTLPAAPPDNERTVAEPLEDTLATLPRLELMRTYVQSTSVGFLLRFEAETDLDVAYDQVRDRLDRAAPRLPEGARDAFIWRHNPNDQPIYVVGVTYPASVDDPHHTLAQRLARPLERLPGVSRVEIQGVEERTVRVEVDDDRARAHGVDAGALVRALQRDNFTLAAGVLEEDGRRVPVRSVTRFDSLEAVRAVPVAPGVTLGDVARVFFGTDPDPDIHRIDGAPAATLNVYKESTANTVAVCEAVAAELAAREAGDPQLEGFRLTAFFDQGSYIRRSIRELEESALYGGLIAVTILFFFLRSLGMTLLVALAIPLCLLATVVVLYFNGDSLNVMSMMGLMLSVGMVVDNAIVVLENIDRHRRAGAGAADASVRGAAEVQLAITLATLTTMVVFLPLILLNENPVIAFHLGKIGFPVCYALGASLFVALVYIPAGARAIPARRAAPHGALFEGLQRAYGRLLGACLRHRTAATLLILGALASSAFPAGRVRRVDRIDADLDSMRYHVRGPVNGSHAELDETVRLLERRLLARKDELGLRAVLARRGWSREHAIVEVFLVEPDARPLEKEDLRRALRALLPDRPGFSARLGWSGGGTEAGIPLLVTGPDTAVAARVAADLVAHLRAVEGVEGAALEDADEGRELRFLVARDAAERAGLSPLVIGGTLDYTLRGRRLADFHTAAREVAMQVVTDPADRTDLTQLDDLPVVPRDGVAPAAGGAPLGVVTRIERARGYGRIRRDDRRTAVGVRVTGDETRLFGRLQAAIADFPLPPGYAVDLGARFHSRRQNEEGGAFALGVAIALVFFVMGLLFESFILPFSILLSIPLAFAGVFWTLYLTDTPLDIMAIVGSIILVGIVVNNGIVLIDQVQQRRREGASRDDALIEITRHRVRPILMTALTTIGGLLPMAFGRAALLGIEYYPLGRVVIGGLLTGTLLTLFAVPVFYAMLDDLRAVPARARRLLGAVSPS